MFALTKPANSCIIQSESCGLQIPQIDLVLQAGTLRDSFTTLEGILDQVYEEPFVKVFVDTKTDDGVVKNFPRQTETGTFYPSLLCPPLLTHPLRSARMLNDISPSS